jgi:tetratricopeptide (TPR) repeat protein
LAKIEYKQGNVRQALELCDKAIESVHKTKDPKLNRADVAYCVKAEILLKENESEKALDALNSLKNFIGYDDSYA